LWHRSLAVTVIAAIVAIMIPAAPADADDGLTAIDPLQTATHIESLATRTIVAADLSKNLGLGAPVTDSQIVKPPLPPIAFKPFAIVDPKASPAAQVPISRDATIVTPGGKTVSAGAYWDEINAVEKDLNSRGQSLRNGTKFDLGRLAGSTQDELLATKMRNPQIPGTTLSVNGKLPPVSVAQALQDRSPLSEPSPLDTSVPTGPVLTLPVGSPIVGKTQHGISTPSPTPTPTATPTEPPPNTLRDGIKDEHRKPLNPLPPEHDTIDFADLTYSKSYTESEGSKGSAEFYLKADLTASATKSGDQNVMGKVSTGAYILGGGGDIASATASVDGTDASLDIEAIGSTIWKKDGQLNPGGKLNEYTNENETFVSFSVPIQIEYFVVTLAASVSGTVGLQSQLNNSNTTGGGITFMVVPFVSVGGSFSVSVGVGIADVISVSVGIQGNLTLASMALPLISSAGFYMDQYHTGTADDTANVYACRARFSYGLRAELNYQFLAGNVSVFLRGCFIFCDTIFSLTLFSWKGITGNDTLFKIGGRTAIGDWYTDAPEYGYHTLGTIPWKYSEDGSDGRPKACKNFYDRFGS
jgi:hypothetical protein